MKTALLFILLLAPLRAPALETGEPENGKLSLEDIRTFVDVLHQIESNFVEEFSEKQLMQFAIEGMMQRLDPWSEYMDASRFNRFDDSAEGRYGGIGVQLDIRKNRIYLATITPGGPADQAGLVAGDLILAVDDQPVKGRRLSESSDALLGVPGSTVKLRIKSGNQPARNETLIREYLPVASVFRKRVEDNIAVFHISHFTRNTDKELAAGIKDLQSMSEQPIHGLVLDLRGNPGGVIGPAVDIADGFLDEGVIVYTRSRYEPARFEIKARPGQWLPGVPVVILVDEQSASASEVLTGALQDHGRAVVMGTVTYGKGSIQSILTLRNGAALKLTTARYFTPSGRVIHENGIQPDIALEGESIDALQAEIPDEAMAAALQQIKTMMSAAMTKSASG